MHDGPAGGHFASNTTVHKVTRVGFHWATLFKDAQAYVCKFLVCHRCIDKTRRSAAMLQTIAVE